LSALRDEKGAPQGLDLPLLLLLLLLLPQAVP
jgi:hypothetical protein